ncbi:PHD finger protein At1g33420 [Elaeis guineensis]|uniref:PHD finger protein At1g33420 n=1 Tax=Elaeis guineensis var. tenera TaxID=51953 RepID=UPI003C6DB3EC
MGKRRDQSLGKADPIAVDHGRSVKRTNRRVTAEMYDFLTFPATGDEPSSALEGPFRRNVREFVARCGRSVPPLSALLRPTLATWRVAFRVGGEADDGGRPDVELDVVEDDVACSKDVYCDDCRVVGWSGHPVCGKRYHFIIRHNVMRITDYWQGCPRCRAVLPCSCLRCNTCNYEIKSDDVEDWMHFCLDDPTHLLHGVVHANGYGHLRRINGREGGSKLLSGCDIMDFWDRLCEFLRVRKVTVMDVSMKRGMVYRLLHAVTRGRSWYGDWGYQFGSGSFGLTADVYQKAVNTLSSTPLSLFLPHDRPPRTQLQGTISFYQALSDRPLRTVRALFKYVIQLHQDSQEQNHSEFTENMAWTEEDAMKAEDAIIKVLRAVGGCRWVTQRSLRGATCRIIRSPQLLDYCLKRIGGKSTDDGAIVAIRCTAGTNVIEYRPSAHHLLHDMRFLYDALLNPATMQPYKPQLKWQHARRAASKLLDCKRFVKHYDKMDDLGASNPFAIHVCCRIEVVDWPKDYTAPPPELLVLPAAATVADLKSEVSKAFQETYLIFQTFQAEQLLVDHKGVNDSTQIKHILGSDESVRVGGRCLGGEDKLERYRMERGMDEWLVDCICGVKDDDGERMLACDMCGVWQHTICSGISDLDEVPSQFVCRECGSSSESAGSGSTISGDTTTLGRCQNVAVSSATIEGKYRSLTPVG